MIRHIIRSYYSKLYWGFAELPGNPPGEEDVNRPPCTVEEFKAAHPDLTQDMYAAFKQGLIFQLSGNYAQAWQEYTKLRHVTKHGKEVNFIAESKKIRHNLRLLRKAMFSDVP